MQGKSGTMALIPAAGSGSRMGGVLPKTFMRIDGDPMIIHTLSVFESSRLVDGVVVICPDKWIRRMKSIVARSGLKKVIGVIPGGARRSDSVAEGIKFIDGRGGCEIVAIHDGARPCLEKGLLDKTIREAKVHGAAIAAVQATDTVKVVRNGVIRGTLDRKVIWLAQTPQCFRWEIIRKAYSRKRARAGATDDSALAEMMGARVRVVEGTAGNIKVTYGRDLKMASLVLSEGT